MNENTKQQLFKELDKVMLKHLGTITGSEFFKLVSEYQLTRLDEIEKFKQTQQERSLYRTAMYNTELLAAYKKTTSVKKQEKMIFKLVNLLCIANPSLKAVEMASPHDQEIFEIVCSYRERIVSNKDWYLRVIPESKWFIEYLEKNNG